MTVKNAHESGTRARKGQRMKIWIDLDNTPHVPFFAPIAEELERRGYDVVLTARSAFQVQELADHWGLQYTAIGRHHGKHRLLKVLGLIWRAIQLLPFYLRERPDIAFSHGSRAQGLICNLLRVPTVLATDYEHARVLPLAASRWLILPEALSESQLAKHSAKVLYYRGLKEDVYAPLLAPDASAIESLGLAPEDLIVVVRPPATEAHYHNHESDELFDELMSLLVGDEQVRTVLLPRNERQERELEQAHPEWLESGRVIVPPQALDGLNLIWFADLVVSGGGTMNREAAAVGVPAYSVFRGSIGAIDKNLAQTGRLVLIERADQVRSLIRLVRRDKNSAPDRTPRPALLDIADHLETIIEAECGRRA